MDKDLLITKQDLMAWLERPLSDNDIDLCEFIATRLENFYKLEKEKNDYKDRCEKALKYFKSNYKRILENRDERADFGVMLEEMLTGNEEILDELG